MTGPALTIALLLRTPKLIEASRQWLPENRYTPVDLGLDGGAVDVESVLERQREAVDAVVIEQSLLTGEVRESLLRAGLLFPAVVVGEVMGHVDYHPEEVHLPVDQLEQLGYNVDAAISRFLRQGQKDDRQGGGAVDVEGGEAVEASAWRLSSRLQERLGYLGVFYKRDPSRFLSHLPPDEQAELLKSLQRESFVNTAFFGDLPITRAVEIHMNLIDDFWKQLRLEGHKNDFLQDYRLALLDVMAHLCEMYRRSIPPDVPLVSTAALQRKDTVVATDREVSP
ncbi:MAG: circadian clock protein KaiA [Synechococcaceae bacterium WB9_4xC_028]|nr:circadian clock protein KaiA [Synechococcaceae bacterium WB9_4xC_028]